ncbi:hypothetical protein N7532_010731 [Penicillium argentinense]|uniref:Uncharacterized protein n=1 Tax=Penicillium argentinense TaxID=1131581 RepID=A0A9W9EQD4_9EURO|nr:uncharacterized protein N7532_010731 [Penicillium argentinense]KAJ5085960.1 hypothetical protein N7532_010731 [Penicillium argentinense]
MPPSPVASWSPFLSLLCLCILPVSGDSGVLTEHWTVNQRPPLDKALLGIQVGSIFAAYVIFVAVLLALLLLVGRRLRRTVQSSNYSLQMQMLKPVKPPISLDPSPVSPISHNLPSPRSHQFTTSWGSIHRGARPSQSSVNGSMVTVDESVVASDRQRAQDQMEMLYAAVMEHDAQKASGVDVSVRGRDSQSQSPDSQYTNPFTDRHAAYAPEQPPLPPLKSPKSSRFSNSPRLSKLFSLRSGSNPDAGKLRSPKFPIRKMGISSPLASPDSWTPQTYSHEPAPLSPRFYNPGPPPVAPASPAAPRAPPPAAFGANVPSPGRARPPAPLNLATASPQAQSSQSSLPFREAYPLQSAPATKTTILERPTKNRTGPITGVPTPYSAYMPFTPVTPFTPGRTVTKRQRRREEKENGLRVLNEDDLVKDDEDMW